MFLNFVEIAQISGGEFMFFDVYASLCASKGKKPSVVAAELGINKSNVSNWKNNGYTPRGEVLQRIADYFGVSTDYLLGKENAPAESGKRAISDDDIKFALWGDCEDISDADLADVKRYAAFVRERKKDQQ
jgi:transcriptional regulator with XRE-family HTH domain